jgi:hypothetical protein
MLVRFYLARDHSSGRFMAPGSKDGEFDTDLPRCQSWMD